MIQIPYPGTEELLTKFGSDPAGRAAARAALEAQILTRARAFARKAGKSMSCAGRLGPVEHATPSGGCANGGGICICECHDRPTK